MTQPKVSVCIVAYNHGRFIDDCIESVVSQSTSFLIELVVGEDCSTDDTRKRLLAWQKRDTERIRLLLHQVNIGALENFRAVLTACRGTYIAHLDGDDMMLPGKLQKQVDILDAEPGIAIVAHDMAVLDDAKGKVIGRYGGRRAIPSSGTLDDLVRYGTYFCHSSKMFRRTCLEHSPLDRTTFHAADWLFHMQNAVLGRIRYLDEVLGVYRHHHASSSSSLNRDRLQRLFLEQIYTVRQGLVLGAAPESVAAGLDRLYYSIGVRCLSLGMYKDFQEFIGRSTNYYNFKHWLYFRLRALPRLLYGIERLRTAIRL